MIDFGILQPTRSVVGKTQLDLEEQAAKINAMNSNANSQAIEAQGRYARETAMANTMEGENARANAQLPSQLEQQQNQNASDELKIQAAQQELNDKQLLRQASSRSLDDFQNTLDKIDPQAALDFKQHQQRLKNDILQGNVSEQQLSNAQLSATHDKINSLGSLALLTDNMVQRTGNADIYNQFKPLFRQIDQNAPDKYSRTYLASLIAAATPISSLLNQRPELLDSIVGPRSQSINNFTSQLHSDLGKQYGDLVTLSQLPGQAGQTGKMLLAQGIQNALNSQQTQQQLNQIKLQEAQNPQMQDIPKPSMGYEYYKDNQGQMQARPIPNGPADKMTPQVVGQLTMLNAAQSDFDKIDKLIFNKDGSINRQNIISANAMIPKTEGRDLRDTMFRGVESLTRSMMPRYNKDAARMYNHAIFPQPGDTDEQVRTKIARYKNDVRMAYQLLQQGHSTGVQNTLTSQKAELDRRKQEALDNGANPVKVDMIYQQELNKLGANNGQ